MNSFAQECLDRHLLELVEMPGQGDGVVDGTKFRIGGTTGKFFPTVKLPAGVTCENCVLQWYWTTGMSVQLLFELSRSIPHDVCGLIVLMLLHPLLMQGIARDCVLEEATDCATRNPSSIAQM